MQPLIRFHFLLSGKFWIEISQGNTIFFYSKNKNSGCTRFSRCAIFISWIGINTTRYVDWLNSKSSIESKRIKICWDKNLHGIVDKQFTINSLSRFSLVEKKKKNFSQLCNESNTACACVCVTTTGNTQYAKVDYLLRINLSDALLFRHQRLVPFYRVVHSRCSKAKYSSTVRVQCQDAV